MRLSAKVATVGLCAIGLAGCGAEEAADKVKQTVDPVARAAEKTAASGGARIDGGMVLHIGQFKMPMTIKGAVSFEDHRMHVIYDIEAVKGLSTVENADLQDEVGVPIELTQTPGEMFVSTGQVRKKGQKDGIDWIKLDLSELDEKADLDLQRANQFSEANPDALLRSLRTTGDARKVGTDNIRGAVADRYKATIDMRRYPELAPPEDRDEAERTARLMIKEWGGPTVKLDVWIDKQGLILRERMPLSFKEAGRTFKTTMVIDFLDVGRPQQVDTPEDRETVDVTDQAAEKLGG